MGINQYIPCVALNTIANVPYWLSLSLMLVLSIVFTFLVSYSSIGIHLYRFDSLNSPNSLMVSYYIRYSDVYLIFKIFQGGLKAAITADAIQGSVLILVSALISIQGAYETGTVKDVYEINKKNGKLNK